MNKIKTKTLTIAAIIFLFAVLPLHSQGRDRDRGNTNPQPVPVPVQPASAENFLGLLPTEVVTQLGSPEFVYPLRGNAHWQDNVIFYYTSNHLYIFFFDNRVWQIRFDHRSSETIVGITPGMGKANVREILGNPYHAEENEDIYLNPAGLTRSRRGFPIRLRLIYDQNNNLHDIYLYRGDF